ncbi:Eco57I restriction-modification methylase domain-containing protein [Microvirga calopogonii]|uniref:Eco57I restriction-modification methylase domain-containing protein n=1 Tax=Microvirga calopogonii TaxID=2078013 RepID=UPI00197B2227|nr:N-6 DNA methylase [Microvirga calopogonii]
MMSEASTVAINLADQIDECREFSRSKRVNISEIATRFGISLKEARSRVQLTTVAPQIIALFRQGHLDLEQIEALSITSDFKAQEKVIFHALNEWAAEPDQIRLTLSPMGISEGHRLVGFVGLDAYKAAGGFVQHDLFGEPGNGTVSDPSLLVQLASRKLNAISGQVKAEGWKWVSTGSTPDAAWDMIPYRSPELSLATPLTTVTIPGEWIAVSGTLVGVDEKGALKIQRGLVKPQDLEAVKQLASANENVPAAQRIEIVTEPQPVLPQVEHPDITATPEEAPALSDEIRASEVEVATPEALVEPSTDNADPFLGDVVIDTVIEATDLVSITPEAELDGRRNYRIQPGELKRQGSWKETAKRNIDIIELAKAITADGRDATDEEKSLLTKYTGWGASEIANGMFGVGYRHDWYQLSDRLKALLSDDEYQEAKRTTQYAHYTSEAVITSIFKGMQRLGFTGGSILEPGMGIGLFNGLMPEDMAAASTYTGIEYDAVSASIARLLYPRSHIITGDYAKTALPRDFFDAAIGNPPFSSTKVLNDPEYKKQSFLLHDYFIAKTIDRVREGGIVVLITSKGTMDKKNDKARRYMAERADLVAAIRLPQTAFKENAGTQVVTDVLFLRKRMTGEKVRRTSMGAALYRTNERGEAVGEPVLHLSDWMETSKIAVEGYDFEINEYFVANPEMVLGRHSVSGSMHRAVEYSVDPLPDVTIEDAFDTAILTLPEGIYARRPKTSSIASCAANGPTIDLDPSNRKVGGLYLSDDGTVMQFENGIGQPLTQRFNSSGKAIDLRPSELFWLKGYIKLRDALKKAQADQLNDGNWEFSLARLNETYDSFVKSHGRILQYTVIERSNPDGTVTETKRFKDDPLIRIDAEGALAYALETIAEDGEIRRGPVLQGRVLKRDQEPAINTTQDALFVSLNRLGRLDIDDVARLAQLSRDEVIADLGTSIFKDPAGCQWVMADEYLSGNVVQKLKDAMAACNLDPSYKRNVEALMEVQPKQLAASDIMVRLGANWIPTTDIEEFAQEVIGDRMKVAYTASLGSWTVTCHHHAVSEWSFDRMESSDVLQALLNSKQIKIVDRHEDGSSTVNVEATEKANDIATKMREAFQKWLWTDADRTERLVSYYNENFNNIAPRVFDGSHLTLPGLSLRFSPYAHQKRAVWRIIQQGDVYLAHSVGAGKTFEMIAGSMEQKRLGLISKPMFVVPNHMLAQFSREFLEIYPAANILVADEYNFHTHNRRRFLAMAALNNPDAIVITHSAFGRIGMSNEFYKEFIDDQIREWEWLLQDVDSSDRRTRKQIERRIEALERRLEARLASDKKDQVLTFEELGVDFINVDEAHEFRKLDFATNQGNIKGIDPAGSQRALDLFMKVDFLRRSNKGRAIVMASGTAITNTMGELFTVQRFFQPAQLEADGLGSFDAWAAQYGDIVAGFEQNAAGGYEIVSRFAKFYNVPELMRRVRSFMDILSCKQLGELVERPLIEGGQRQIVVTPVPTGYKEYQKELEARIKAIRNRSGAPKKGDDIILTVIADGRFSAIDMRFVDPNWPADPDSKLNRMLSDAIDAYHETADFEFFDPLTKKPEPLKGATSIIFTDIGLGEQSAINRGFDMKARIQHRLVEGGVRPEHIAFMRDHKQHAKKERLFAEMREGKKRILIGGKDMETGVNVQKRLYDLFHLDAPWFPASVQQREGRIERQGNQNSSVRIRAYATKGSYDSTMWGMNARKARFIEQAMNGDDTIRSMDDVSEASAFQMAAALASGDERYMRVAGLRADVERLERLRQAHNSEQGKLRSERRWAEKTIESSTSTVEIVREAIKQRQPVPAGEFNGIVEGLAYDKREAFGNAIIKAVAQHVNRQTVGNREIGNLAGFNIVFVGIRATNFTKYSAEIYMDLPGDPDPILTYPFDQDLAPGGIATRGLNQVGGLERLLYRHEDEIQRNQRKIEQIRNRLGVPFAEEAVLLEKLAELSALEEELAAEKAAEAAAADEANETEEPEQDQIGSEDEAVQDGIEEDAQVAPLASSDLNQFEEPPQPANDDLAFTQMAVGYAL